MFQSLEQVSRELGRVLSPRVFGQYKEKSEDTRFELFYAANSVCSHKVRAVLTYHNMPCRSHILNLTQGQTYLPAYIRLRLFGCAMLNSPLVVNHTGSTSVKENGCDPAVVPTRIDWKTRRVLADSKQICFYLDQNAVGMVALRPVDLCSDIDIEVDIIDDFPNYQLLAGKNGVELTNRKVDRCNQRLLEVESDLELIKAYSAKRLKELSAGRSLFTPSAIRAAYQKVEGAFDQLERKLSDGRQWLIAGQFTLADLFWGVQLLHMKGIALERFWIDGRRPAVAEFLRRMESLPALRVAASKN